MTFNVRLNAYISHERWMETNAAGVVFLWSFLSFPIFFSYKAVVLHDRCIGWCESEIGLVVF